jgi:hypothetical protein
MLMARFQDVMTPRTVSIEIQSPSTITLSAGAIALAVAQCVVDLPETELAKQDP